MVYMVGRERLVLRRHEAHPGDGHAGHDVHRLRHAEQGGAGHAGLRLHVQAQEALGGGDDLPLLWEPLREVLLGHRGDPDAGVHHDEGGGWKLYKLLGDWLKEYDSYRSTMMLWYIGYICSIVRFHQR